MQLPRFRYPDIALHACRIVLQCVGCFALLAYLANMHVYLMVPSVVFLAGFWYVTYQGEIAYRTRRLEGSTYR